MNFLILDAANRMMALFPIFPLEEEIYWQSPKGRNLILASLQNTTAISEFTEVIALTDNECLCYDIRSWGYDAYMTSNDHEYRELILTPQGVKTCIGDLIHELKISAEHVAIINFRNPLLTVNLLEKAIDEYRSTNSSCLISIIKSQDHPCQLQTYQKTKSIELIYLFEKKSQLKLNGIGSCEKGNNFRHFEITRPFPFKWDKTELGGARDGSLFTREMKGPKSVFTPLKEDLNLNTDHRACLWVKEGENSARRIVFPPLPTTLNVPKGFIWRGASFKSDKINLMVFENPFTDETILSFGRPMDNSNVCNIKILSMVGNQAGKAYDLSLPKAGMTITLPQEIKSADFAIFFLLQDAENNFSDFMEPFPALPDLWTLDEGRPVNTLTGEVITGTQQFPDVFEPDGSFIFFHSSHAESLNELIMKGLSKGFELGETESLIVYSEYDFLAYEALIKGRDPND